MRTAWRGANKRELSGTQCKMERIRTKRRDEDSNEARVYYQRCVCARDRYYYISSGCNDSKRYLSPLTMPLVVVVAMLTISACMCFYYYLLHLSVPKRCWCRFLRMDRRVCVWLNANDADLLNPGQRVEIAGWGATGMQNGNIIASTRLRYVLLFVCLFVCFV